MTILKLIAQPQKIYFENSAAGQVLNFDFVVENLTNDPWRLEQIEVSVFDSASQFVTRKFVDESGGIQTIPDRIWAGQTSALVFNPFFLFDHHVELKTLRYQFTFVSVTAENEKVEKRERIETIISPAPYQTKTSLRLPVKERAIIWDGHDFYSHHRRFNYFHPMLQHVGFKSNCQRYAYDFVPINHRGEMFQGDAEKNEAWLGFGTPVYAAASGIVADMFEGMPDNRQFEEMEMMTRAMVVFGNYILLDHQNGEYSCFAHLKQGSILVKPGQEVHQGQIIGQIGASGSSLFPHLHYELRDGLGIKEVEGLPSYFQRFRRILGSNRVNVVTGQIDTGDIVEQEG